LGPCPGGPKIGRITTAGAVNEYPLPTCVGGGGSIAAGADGALWYSTFDPAIIGRITTSGVITEYPLGTIGAVPFDLIAGPDGALWFLLSDF
jgi:virginiamycin B lyase